MADSQSSRRRMLNVDQIDNAITEIAAACAAEGVSAVLIGGVAMHHYGSDRFTADVDFAARQPLAALPASNDLSFGGYQAQTPSGVPVAWVIRNDDFADLFAEATEYPRRLEGVPVPVVSPEYLVAMKMVARRPKDLLDLQALLTLGVVDNTKALGIVKRLLGAYAAEDLRSHIAEAEWRSQARR
jgi:hypothetical protein